jgi:integral membrane sensor domain MASE1
MARFKENDLPKSKLPLVLLKAKIIFKYAGNNSWKFYVGLVLLLTSVTAFPKFMGMLVDCVNKRQ